MSNMDLGKIGDQVVLQGASATKLYVGDIFMGHGYIISGEKFIITIEGIVGDCLIGHRGSLYPIVPQHNDDFYLVEEVL